MSGDVRRLRRKPELLRRSDTPAPGGGRTAALRELEHEPMRIWRLLRFDDSAGRPYRWRSVPLERRHLDVSSLPRLGHDELTSSSAPLRFLVSCFRSRMVTRCVRAAPPCASAPSWETSGFAAAAQPRSRRENPSPCLHDISSKLLVNDSLASYGRETRQFFVSWRILGGVFPQGQISCLGASGSFCS